ncbi:unnamed protein product, partial [Medioppia subpectinata]
MQKCIVDYLGPKIRILVTHQIQFIRKATKILVLDDGKCLGLGTFDELLPKGLDFMANFDGDDDDENADAVVAESEGSSVHTMCSETDTKSQQSAVTVRADSVRSRRTVRRLISNTITRQISVIGAQEEEEAPHIQDEQQKVGSIEGRVYWEYIRAGAGIILGTLTILSTCISQVLFHASDLWLMQWTNHEKTQTKEKNNFALIIYAILIVALLLSTMVRSTTWFAICMIASKRLHNTIFIRLLRAPMAVFDNNPI